jgi:hypothetical protein
VCLELVRIQVPEMFDQRELGSANDRRVIEEENFLRSGEARFHASGRLDTSSGKAYQRLTSCFRICAVASGRSHDAQNHSLHFGFAPQPLPCWSGRAPS